MGRADYVSPDPIKRADMNQEKTTSRLRTLYVTLNQLGFWISVLAIFCHVYQFFGPARSGRIICLGLFLIGLLFDWLWEREPDGFSGSSPKILGYPVSRRRVSRWALAIGLAVVIIAERFVAGTIFYRFGFLALLLPVWAALLRIPIREADGGGGSFLTVWRLEIMILGLTFLMLEPMLRGGYYWDDAVNATIYGIEKIDGVPLLENILTFMRRYLELGRINILSIYYYFFFYIRDPLIYKSLILIFILLNQVIAAKVVRMITGSKRMGQLVMLIVLLSFQFRPYQDALNGFYALMQLILILLLGTVYWLVKFTRTNQFRYLAVSLILFCAGLFTYEVVFPFILMIPLLVWADSRRIKRALLISLPYILVWGIALVTVYYVRSNLATGTAYSGVTFNLNAQDMANAYRNQTLAAFPLNYHIFGNEASILGRVYSIESIFRFSPLALIRTMTVKDFGLSAIAAALLFRVFSRLTNEARPSRLRTLGVLGGSLLFLSGSSIAISQRYQGQLTAGLGYLPVYLGYFGFAVLVAMAIGAVSYRLRRRGYYYPWILKFMVTVYVTVFAVTIQDNRKILNLLDQAFLHPYRAGRAALEMGIFDFLPDGATVLSTNPGDYLWEANWNNTGIEAEFYTLNSGRDFLTGNLQAGRFNPNDPAYGVGAVDRPQDIYLFAYDGDPLHGTAKLGRLVSVEADSAGNPIVLTDTVLYFLDGNLSPFRNVSYLREDGVFVNLTETERLRVRVTAHGSLFNIPQEEIVLFESIDLSGF